MLRPARWRGRVLSWLTAMMPTTKHNDTKKRKKDSPMNITPEFRAYCIENGLSLKTAEDLRAAHAAFTASVTGKKASSKAPRTPDTYVAVRMSDLEILHTGKSGDCRTACVADDFSGGDGSGLYLVVTQDDWLSGHVLGTASQIAADGRGRPKKESSGDSASA